MYCSEEGRTGSDREAVVAKHTANPFAPSCGNPSCGVFEETEKQFRKCSQCRKIASCSSRKRQIGPQTRMLCFRSKNGREVGTVYLTVGATSKNP